MTYREQLMGSCAWNLRLKRSTPRRIRRRLDIQSSLYAHVVVCPLHLGVEAQDGLLSASRFVGRLISQDSPFEWSGDGVNAWLGDADGKGDIRTSVVAKASPDATRGHWVNTLRPGWMPAGPVTPTPGVGIQFVKSFEAYSLVRDMLNAVAAFFSDEWRVTNDFKLEYGAPSLLYRTTPQAVIIRRRGDSGRDRTVIGLPGDFDLSRDGEDWVRTVRYVANTTPPLTTENGSIAGSNVPYRDPFGGPAEIATVIEDTSTTNSAAAAGLAAAAFGRLNTIRSEMRLSTDLYDIGRDVRVGDRVWVYDPEMGIENPANQVQYRGETIFPEAIRCVAYTAPIRQGMGVYLRRWVKPSSTWVLEWTDLTDYVEWDTGEMTVEVANVPRRLTTTRRPRVAA